MDAVDTLKIACALLVCTKAAVSLTYTGKDAMPHKAASLAVGVPVGKVLMSSWRS